MTSTPVELADNVRERLASHDWGTLAPRVIGALEYSQELVDGLRRLPCLAVRRSRLLDLSGARASWQEDYTTFGWARQARQ